MGDRIIHYYEFPERQPDWAEIKRFFKRNVSRHNVPFFEADSEAEHEFKRFCHASNLVTQRKTVIEFDGRGTEADRFLFLVLKDDKGQCLLEAGRGFVDLAAACPGGGAFGICGRGASQVDRVLVKPERVERVARLGLLACRRPNVPRIFLASAKVGAALKEAGATGCEIAPTDTLDCCQLRITTETAGPTRIGQARMGKRCPVCGVAKFFLCSTERYFHLSDLKTTDFQICRLYQADNLGEFEILNGFLIVSQRIFNLLLGLEIEGLDRYATDPPIRHAVVQIRDA